MKREFPFPLPYSWFQLAYSEELGPGEVKPVRYFGRDLVMFRTERGRAQAFDAFCPHLGAHLGYGGSVVGETLRCPFHAWRYDCSGACVEIPYAKRIPPAAHMKTYPTIERNGMIMAWYHPSGEAPRWEIPEIEELSSEDWTTPVRREWTVRSQTQELAENTVDQAHFRYVHGTNTVASTEIDWDGPLLRVTAKAIMGTVKGEADGTIRILTFGFGFGYTRFSGIVDTLVMTTGTPIDDEHVRMHLSLTWKRLGDQASTEGVGKAFISEIERQFTQDIPIWENKIHLERPVLCDGDGPIGELRKWARQFYVEPDGRQWRESSPGS
ncbi:MAG: Rieske (2Fe-2S) protein [Myxococcales bacterium]|jgi:3-ketosteroid 9alpha-monooxygenase subunit A|nr:MAG: Rieske (2Fe-2S) protein [Myxococcales bacterium]